MKLANKHSLDAFNSILLVIRDLGLINQEDVTEITKTVLNAKNREQLKPLVEKLDKIEIKQGFNGINLENN